MRDYNVIILRYGEISLKGNNRVDFLRQLRANARKKLRETGLDWPVRQFGSQCVIRMIEPSAERLQRALKAVSRVAGITWYAPACRIPPDTAGFGSDAADYGPIRETLLDWARTTYEPGQTFRVRGNRGNKNYPATSPEIEREMGSLIVKETPWKTVKLKGPDRIFYVDVQEDGIYLYLEKVPGTGGLPVGVGGRVLVLFSGGIDSPVAAYLIARRGCPVDLVHFTTTDPRRSNEDDKVRTLARLLSRFTIRNRLFLLPYVYFDMALLAKRSRYDLVLFRRFMIRVAEHLAGTTGALALATGDSIGQVASQTLENLVSSSSGATIPILRPLLTVDKPTIIELAEEIGTFRTSLTAYKDCCAILGKRPKTKSRAVAVGIEEAKLIPDYSSLIDKTLADGLCVTYECGRLVEDHDLILDQTRHPDQPAQSPS